ncbi:MAG: AAA family ATPase [Minicystis sp.]
MSQPRPDCDQEEIRCGRRYTIVRTVGPDGAPRVLKIVRSGRRAASSAAMLRHEHEVIAGLAAVRGVVRTFGLTEVGGALALVLEDAGPDCLKDWLRRRPLGLGAFLRRAIPLAETVAALHEQKIIHRDLNATNVVVSADGERLTLVDFGLATSVAGARGSVAAADFEGTLRAIAPEQTGRVGRPVDHRADLYSLGATLYEMLTGRPPFASTDPAELVHAHLARAPVPPPDVNRAVPKIVGDLVLKLLAKMPEQRYQSAEALVADLREIERRSRPSGAIEPFELGRVDLERELVIPGLYGRDRAFSALSAAFERAAAGVGEIALVTGGAGIGKSTLIRALLGSPAAIRARCLHAKFDELRSNVPYAPLVEAARDLVCRILSEPPDVIDAFRIRIGKALGAGAGAVIEVVPELADLLGAGVPVPGAEAEGRFPLAFPRFVQALAARGSPLVVVLDDLQWADAASLRLLPALASLEARHVLIVGAYRDDQVGPEHPLVRAVEIVAAGGIPVQRLALGPLDLDALASLCEGTLRGAPDRARALAAIVQQKTAGNPLFVERFLRHLHRSGLLVFDADRGAWDWDVRRIAAATVTENVVELMVTTIRGLPEATQRVLTIASCLPGRIELGLLAALAGAPVCAVSRELWSALREGLLVPQAAPIPAAAAGDEPVSEEQVTRGAVYRFVHDRVQEAAYSLLSGDEQKRLHLAAGWKLLEGAMDREGDERLFDAVDQLDRGADLLVAEAERLRVAELDLRAARKARLASAFAQGLGYARRGLALLPEEARRAHPALWVALSREAAECAYLTGDFGGARAHIDDALQHVVAPEDLDRARLPAHRRRHRGAGSRGRRPLGARGPPPLRHGAAGGRRGGCGRARRDRRGGGAARGPRGGRSPGRARDARSRRARVHAAALQPDGADLAGRAAGSLLLRGGADDRPLAPPRHGARVGRRVRALRDGPRRRPR